MTTNLFDAILVQIKMKPKTEKQQKVLEAAIRLFAGKGYAHTSTAEIAEAAGVSEGTIFKHFGTKDRLLLSIMIPFIRELVPQMMDEVIRDIYAKHTSTFEQFLRALIRDRVRFMSQNREIFQVLVKELMYNDPLRNEIFSYISAKFPSSFKQIVQVYKERGELTDLPADTILNLILTFLSGFFVSRFLLMNRRNVSDEEIEEAVQFIMNGIRKKDLNE